MGKKGHKGKGKGGGLKKDKNRHQGKPGKQQGVGAASKTEGIAAELAKLRAEMADDDTNASPPEARGVRTFWGVRADLFIMLCIHLILMILISVLMVPIPNMCNIS